MGRKPSLENASATKKFSLARLVMMSFVTVEELVDGIFVKYINNDGDICGEDVELTEKAECLAHFSYERSQSEVMVLDIQGCGCSLFDPEIASKQVMSEDNSSYLFCTGNLSVTAINHFIGKHKCNFYCRLFDLSEL